MIKADVRGFDASIKNGITNLSQVLTKDKQFLKAEANSLGAGAKAVATKAKSLAPKGGRSKKGQTKTYGKAGLLKKAIKVRSGVSKQNAPFAVVGPSRSVQETTRRGQKSVMQKPSNYAHLVEFGFKAKARVPLVSGRTGESIVKKGVIWKGSDLEKYMTKQNIVKSSLNKGKLARVNAFMPKGQKSVTVPGQKFMERAYSSSKGSIGPLIVERLKTETEKAIARIAKKQAGSK